MLIRCAQREVFGSEISSIEVGKPVGTKSRLKTLKPFLDSSHTSSTGWREIKTVIVPQDHELSHLVILDCHKKLRHEGIEHVPNELRKMYWIPHSPSNVRRVLHNRSFCMRRRIKPQPPLMASLPKDRLQVAPAFSKVGVDYFGPIMVKHLRKQEKRYG